MATSTRDRKKAPEGDTLAQETVTAFKTLERVGLTVKWRDFQTILTDAAKNLADTVQPTPVSEAPARYDDLTTQEIDTLRRGGFDLDTPAPERGNALTRTLFDFAFLVATSLSVADAARLLQVDESRIRQRLAARSLYGIKLHHAWHLPLFQFDGNQVLPGIERVLPRLAADLHPVAVFTWFLRPDPDLMIGLDGDSGDDFPPPASPRDWLRCGGNPDTVARLAESL